MGPSTATAQRAHSKQSDCNAFTSRLHLGSALALVLKLEARRAWASRSTKWGKSHRNPRNQIPLHSLSIRHEWIRHHHTTPSHAVPCQAAYGVWIISIRTALPTDSKPTIRDRMWKRRGKTLSLLREVVQMHRTNPTPGTRMEVAVCPNGLPRVREDC